MKEPQSIYKAVWWDKSFSNVPVWCEPVIFLYPDLGWLLRLRFVFSSFWELPGDRSVGGIVGTLQLASFPNARLALDPIWLLCIDKLVSPLLYKKNTRNHILLKKNTYNIPYRYGGKILLTAKIILFHIWFNTQLELDFFINYLFK